MQNVVRSTFGYVQTLFVLPDEVLIKGFESAFKMVRALLDSQEYFENDRHDVKIAAAS